MSGKNIKEAPAPRMTADKALEMEALARARYFAMSQRRTMPPRCNPFGILFIVLSLGLLFIGVTMTTIAHWPGVTQIGENPLKIAGPVLLGVGGAMFILVIVGVCYCNSRDQLNWDKKITNMALERASSISKEPLVPGHSSSIMTSSFQQPRESYSNSNPAFNIRSSSQPPNYNNFRNPQFPPNNNANYTRRKSGSAADVSASFHDSSFESQPLDSAIPAPLRHQKPRLVQAGSPNGSANTSAEVGAADMSIPGVYYPNRAISQQAYNNSNAPYLNRGGVPVSMNQEPIRDAIQRGQRAMEQDYRARGRHGQGDVPKDQGLRLHIKTQPGTAVHITPSSTPPSRGFSNRGSVDTEI